MENDILRCDIWEITESINPGEELGEYMLDCLCGEEYGYSHKICPFCGETELA